MFLLVSGQKHKKEKIRKNKKNSINEKMLLGLEIRKKEKTKKKRCCCFDEKILLLILTKWGKGQENCNQVHHIKDF